VRIVLKALLLMFLALAMSFQGIAAAGMLPCAHSAPAQMAQQHGGCHDMADADSGQLPACDSCGACSAVPVLAPPLAPAVQAVAPFAAGIPSYQLHLPPGAADQPERPPRPAHG
jgi:hypothetical protein